MSKKLSRRDFLKGAALVAGGSVLAACVVPTSVPQPAAEPAEATAKPAAAPVEIRFAHWLGEQLKAWIPYLQEKTNTTIREEIYDWADFSQKMMTQFAGGTAPDVLMSGDISTMQGLANDLFLPLDDYLDKAGIDMSLWVSDPAYLWGWNGAIRGLSTMTAQPLCAYVNETLVEKAGYPLDKLPYWGRDNYDKWTWTDWVEFLHAVTLKKADGTYEQYGLDRTWAHAQSVYSNSLYSRGGRLYDDELHYAEKECLMDRPENIATAQQLIDLTTKEGVSPSYEAAAGIQGGVFASGMAAARLDFANMDLRDAGYPFKVGMFAWPFVEKRVYPAGNSTPIHANAVTKYPEAAANVCIVQCTDAHIGKIWLDQSGMLLGYNVKALLAQLPAGEQGEVIMNVVGRIKGMSFCDYCSEDVVQWTWRVRTMEEWKAAWRPEVEKVVLGLQTVEEACKNTKAIVDAAIAELPPL